MASDARKLVESVLGGYMTSQVWTSTYTPVFPFTPQGFSVGAVLPMVLYLFRWGHRRGRGQFSKSFGPGRPTITSVVDRLVRSDDFDGFSSPVSRAILGDALLTSSFENKRHAEGHVEQIQRCFPNHFFASWIDLPTDAAHLRNVPEMLVALINGQAKGDKVKPFQEQGRYRVGSGVSENALLQVFASGVTTDGEKSSLKSDRFDEAAEVGLDQLIMVRLAQLCGEAPGRAIGKGEPGPIPNQRPLAKRAALHLREDLLVFLDCYGRSSAIARSPFSAMLEAALSIGLTTIVLQSAAILSHWSLTGETDTDNPDNSNPIFFDCSTGSDLDLRAVSERSSTNIRQVLTRIPSILMYARLLDFYIQTESDLKKEELPPSAPDATSWMELLGSFLNQSHEESRDAEKFFRSKARALSAAAENDPDAGFRTDMLATEGATGSFGRRLAEALTAAFEQVSGVDKLNLFLSSALMIDEPNGLARRRKVSRSGARSKGQRSTADAISFVLSNTALEYLVHRHLRRNGKGRKPQSLSYPEFLRILRERYSFYIDQSPPNMQVPAELLQRNRRHLERRLRDLGLLSGVNDAERMKKLKPRYHAVQDAQSGGASAEAA